MEHPEYREKQAPRVNLAKMVLRDSLVSKVFQGLQEKEALQGKMGSQEYRGNQGDRVR